MAAAAAVVVAAASAAAVDSRASRAKRLGRDPADGVFCPQTPCAESIRATAYPRDRATESRQRGIVIVVAVAE
eukprot:660875-Pyramimonas_sp.AAC.1